jgi:hypothetical protein
MYPFYDKAVKAGITTLCIHKGLLPPDYEKSFAGVWEYATAWDIGKAAKDWPQMNFVIYHSALRPFLELPDQAWAEFESTGRIRWATDLAEIPQKFGVTNVYAELGTSFANSAVAHPKFCAALVGTLIKGMGAIMSCRAPTRSGTARRSGRSRRCAGSKFRRTCRRSTGLRRSATRIAPPSS